MRMSAMAMLQMYMLDLVCRLGLLNQINDTYCLIVLRIYLMTVKIAMRLPVIPVMMIRE